MLEVIAFICVLGAGEFESCTEIVQVPLGQVAICESDEARRLTLNALQEYINEHPNTKARAGRVCRAR